MKTAVLTLFWNTNYGANLQAYALTKVIETITNEPCQLIDYRNNTLRNLYRFSPFDTNGKSLAMNKKSIRRFLRMVSNPLGTVYRFRKFYQFRRKYVDVSEEVYYDLKGLKKLNKYIVFIGSDQVWNPEITKDENGVYFGSFRGPSMKIVTYAPSFGRHKIPFSELDFVKKHLCNIDRLSVREESMRETLSKVTTKDITVVCDPVILLPMEEWQALANKSAECSKHEKYILIYMLNYDKDVVEIAKITSLRMGIPIYLLSGGDRIKVDGVINKKHADPQEFLNLMLHAEIVITNSFHGMVFSTIFGKQFYGVPHPTRGIRMIEFVKKMGIEDRLIYDRSEFNESLLQKSIDYDTVQQRMADFRQVSLKYLEDAISSLQVEK